VIFVDIHDAQPIQPMPLRLVVAKCSPLPSVCDYIEACYSNR